jgi:hypothetical protein
MSPEDTNRSFLAGRETLAFFVLLAAAAAVYFFRLTYSDIWIDESLSKALARHSLPDLLRLVAHDSHPPLYFVALKAFTTLVGNTNFAIRLFSVLGALATLVLGYAVGRRVFGRGGALCLCVLLFALPMPGLYSHVARMYTWAAFLVLGVFLFAILHARENRTSDLVWLGVFSVAATWTHYYSLIAAFWIDLSLLLYLAAKKNRAWRRVAVMGIAVALLFLPWIFVFLSQAETIHKDFWIPPVSWGTVLACYVQPFGGLYRLYDLSWVMAFAAYALTLAAIVVALIRRKNGDHLPLVFALFGFHATIATAAAASLWFRPVLYQRYLMTIVPLLMVPPVVLMLRWRLQWPKVVLLAGSLVCGLFIVFSESGFSFGPNQKALQTLARTHPEVRKILHLNELTAGPLAEYGRGGPLTQYYLKNAGTSWYSNLEAFDALTPVGALGEMVEPGEVFCLAEFVGLPLNGQNMDLVVSSCDILAVEEINDDKTSSGIRLKLHILKVRP